jgi:hypothetical protein
MRAGAVREGRLSGDLSFGAGVVIIELTTEKYISSFNSLTAVSRVIRPVIAFCRALDGPARRAGPTLGRGGA